jgi:hypothetical protein
MEDKDNTDPTCYICNGCYDETEMGLRVSGCWDSSQIGTSRISFEPLPHIEIYRQSIEAFSILIILVHCRALLEPK